MSNDASELSAGEDWSDAEVTATVSSYLSMLRAELAGVPYSKANHRRALLARLRPGRTPAAVEFKHSNVSAVMLELGLPYVRGYKPRGNYQEALAVEIRARLAADGLLQAIGAVLEPAGTPASLQPGVEPPAKSRRRATGRVIDYEALQAENRRLGAIGEELVVDFERSTLLEAGREDLADAVRWVAREDGDGLGYDVASFHVDGRHKHIEVKTTKLGSETPFYLSSAELSFATEHPDTFVLYRLYDVDTNPRFFTVSGDLAERLLLEPVTFRARMR